MKRRPETSDSEETPTLYGDLGGAEGVRRLVDLFYDVMDRLPIAQAIRDMHPDDLASSREKLYLFLSGWTGGPPLYFEKHGHPRLRARHLPFSIGVAERNQWLACMRIALDQHGCSELVRDQLMGALAQVADFMRNRPEELDGP